MSDHPGKRILSVLAAEKAAICAADFGQLDSFAATKADLFNALQANQTSRSDLLAIKEKLSENQTLLRAAINGVAEAQARITAVRNVREELSFYDQSGQISKVQTRRPDMEKKA